MSRARKITAELTEPQFEALSSMVGRGQYEVECEMDDDGMAEARKTHRLSMTAWDKIAGAWYRGGRR